MEHGIDAAPIVKDHADINLLIVP